MPEQTMSSVRITQPSKFSALGGPYSFCFSRKAHPKPKTNIKERGEFGDVAWRGGGGRNDWKSRWRAKRTLTSNRGANRWKRRRRTRIDSSAGGGGSDSERHRWGGFFNQKDGEKRVCRRCLAVGRWAQGAGVKVESEADLDLRE